ncbi:MAG: response regulator [Rubrivivax sp.]|nr:response regulator [Rubrivivax sp.]
MTETIRLLYAEDNPQDADLARACLEGQGDFQLELVDTGARCLARVAAETFDVLLLDNHLPDMDGLDVLARLRADGHTLPVVMVTGSGDEETVTRALRAGAADYLPKSGDYLAGLPELLRAVVARRRSRVQLDEQGQRRVWRILHVEPNAMDVELTTSHFVASAPHLQLHTVPSCIDALALLAAPGHGFDLVLADLRVPGMNALEFLREAQRRGIELPFIVITGRGDEATAVAILRLGAYDYLVKRENYLTQLPHAIDHALERFQLDQATRRLHAELAALNASLEHKVAQRTASLQREIDERQRLEAALRESAQSYRLLFEANPHPMWVYDVQTLAFLAVNDAAVAHYGYRADEFLAMTIADIRPPEDLPRLLETIGRTPRESLAAASVWRHRKKDGTLIDVEITSHAQDFQGRRTRIVLAYDITERRQAEQKVREQLDELLRWQTAMLGREDRVQQLKAEVNELLGRQGQPSRYPSQVAP